MNNNTIEAGSLFVVTMEDIDYHVDLGLWLATQDIPMEYMDSWEEEYQQLLSKGSYVPTEDWIKEKLVEEGAVQVPAIKKLVIGGTLHDAPRPELERLTDE